MSAFVVIAIAVAALAAGLAGGWFLPPNGRNGHKTIANWYLTLLEAAGFRPQQSFGQIDPNLRDLDLRGPLAELMA